MDYMEQARTNNTIGSNAQQPTWKNTRQMSYYTESADLTTALWTYLVQYFHSSQLIFSIKNYLSITFYYFMFFLPNYSLTFVSIVNVCFSPPCKLMDNQFWAILS